VIRQLNARSNFNSKSYSEEMRWVSGAAQKMEPGRTGGFICVARLDGLPLWTRTFGHVPGEKRAEYIRLCQEYTRELGRHHELQSSFQLQEEGKNGVAIRCSTKILSIISGFSRDMNEAMLLALGVGTRTLDSAAAAAIAEISNNQKWLEIQQQLLVDT